ncbi:MAG: hypothetical protein AAFY70_07015 [Bacteroidota bacterium]
MLEKRKLWKLMRLFDKREQSKVSYWLKGELRGHHGATYQLFELMCDPEVSIEQIWASLYPHKALPERPFYDSGFRRLEHSLSGLLETWLAIDSFRQEGKEMDHHLLRALNRRNAKELFSAKYKKVRRRLEEQPARDSSYHRELYRLTEEHLIYLMKFDKLRYRSTSSGLLEKWEQTVVHERLRHGLTAINSLSTFHDATYEGCASKYLANTQKWLDIKRVDNDPVLKIYYHLILLICGRGDVWLMEKELKENLHLFSAIDQINVYTTFLNYCFRRSVTDSSPELLPKILTLLEWGLEKRLIYLRGTLRETMYRSLIMSCIYSHQLELGEYYLEKLKEDLLPEIRDEVYSYTKGRLLVAKGEYHEATKYLYKKFRLPRLEFRARKLMIQIKYERGERVELENEIRALLLYVERSKTLHRVLRNQITKEYKLLDRLIQSFRKDDLLRLREEVSDLSTLFDRNWLLEKIDEKLNCVHTPLLD